MKYIDKQGPIALSILTIPTLVLILIGASVSAKPILMALQADLIPVTNNFRDNGVIFVVNQGTQSSKSTWLTLQCSGICPEFTSIDGYRHSSFPNRIAVKIPALKSGQTFRHKLKFWQNISFNSGKAKIVLIVDADNTVTESNEENNDKSVAISTHKITKYLGSYSKQT